MTLLALSLAQAVGLSLWFYAVTAYLSRRLAPPLALAAAVALIGAASMAVFWAVFFLPVLADVIVAGFWLGALACALHAVRSPRDNDAAIAAVLWAVSLVGMLLWTFWPTGTDDMLEVARNRWLWPLPIDNELPLIFARDLIAGHIPHPFVGDWLSSDRPPLQAGFFLLARIPFVGLATSYQVCATGAEMLMIPAAYVLARAFGVGRVTACLAAALVFFAPVTIVNGAYVWPKLLAAAFLAAAASVHFSPIYDRVKTSYAAGLVTGTAVAAGLLSHGGAAFSVVGLGLAALFSFRFATRQYLLAAVAGLVVMYAPWAAYQQFYDPPGDRLVKWHLAGVVDTDTRSAVDAIRDAYGRLTPGAWAEQVWRKAEVTAAAPFAAVDPALPLKDRRGAAFFRPLPAMGVVGLPAILAVLAGLFWRETFAIALGSVLSYLAWIVLEFRVADVIVHQGSYVVLLGPIVMLAIMLRRWPPVVLALAVAEAGMAIATY